MGGRRLGGRRRPERAGNAGLIATFAIALAGIGVGAISAYVSDYGAAASARNVEIARLSLREGEDFQSAYSRRAEVVELVLRGVPLQRLPAPVAATSTETAPTIYMIIDDMGVNEAASRAVFNLPGPITASFLPYARNVETLTAEAQRAGLDLMLHLPMEPIGEADPGPHALGSGMTGAEFLSELDWNLSRFDGYVGVNNHMGSQLTGDVAAMKTILGYLKNLDLFFLDSVTTGDTVVRPLAAGMNVRFHARDVFIDAETNSVDAVKRQLRLAEDIARQTGYVVAIGHPREETLQALGPWLATAPARGLRIAPISELDRQIYQTPIMSAEKAPTLRG